MTKRRCVALRVDGQRCRAWAVRQPSWEMEGPALCAAHGGLSRSSGVAHLQAQPPAPYVAHGVVVDDAYGGLFEEVEVAAVEAALSAGSVEGEVGLVRVGLRRLFAGFSESRGLTPQELNARALTMVRGAEPVGRLLQIQLGLEASRAELPEEIGQALDALGEELGLNL